MDERAAPELSMETRGCASVPIDTGSCSNDQGMSVTERCERGNDSQRVVSGDLTNQDRAPASHRPDLISDKCL